MTRARRLTRGHERSHVRAVASSASAVASTRASGRRSAVARPEPGGAFGDVRREGLDADAEIGQESPDERDRIGPAAPGVDEDLGIRARRQDQRLPPCPAEGLDRRGVVRVVRVEERDDDARVEDGYRHSRRSFRRDPLG